MVLNETSFAVSGRVTVNGATPVMPAPCDPNLFTIRFVGTTHTASTSLGCTTGAITFALNLPADTYSVSVFSGSSDSNLLRGSALVASAFVVSGSSANNVFNETSVPIAGRLTVNGVTPVSSTCTSGRANVHFSSPAYSYSPSIPCSSSDFSFSTFLPPGTYRVSVEERGPSNLLDSVTIVATAFVVSGPNSAAVFNETSFAVSGRVTVNGATPLMPSPCDPNLFTIRFVGTTHTASTSLGCTTGAVTFALNLPADTYSVSVFSGSSDSNLLRDSALVASAFVVSNTSANNVFNETSVAISGRLTVNSATPIASTCSSGRASVHFSSPAYSFSPFIPCSSSDFSFSTFLPPGTYRVSVEERGPSNLLDSVTTVATAFVVSGPNTAAVFNETSFAVSGRVTVNGATPVMPSPCDPNLFTIRFVGTTHTASTSLGCTTGAVTFALNLPADTYSVSVSSGTSDSNLLRGSALVVNAFVVSGSSANNVFNETSVPVSGRLTVNGATPIASTCTSGRANVHFSSPAYSFSPFIPCSSSDFSFSTFLPPGTYRVSVEEYGPSNLLDSVTLVADRVVVP